MRAPAEAADAVPVYLSQYGRHARVALPAADPGKFVEFGFGEWHYYGLEDHGAVSTIRAITGLGAGALSRRELTAAPDGTLTPAQAGSLRSESLRVERARAEALRSQLEARWLRNRGNVRIRTLDGVPVSRDPARYTLFRNSNSAAADWLRDLGCDVRGLPIQSNFRVAE